MLAYQWLMEKFPEHFLDITSPEERMTTYAAEVLKKFSPFWSDDQFDQMAYQNTPCHFKFRCAISVYNKNNKQCPQKAHSLRDIGKALSQLGKPKAKHCKLCCSAGKSRALEMYGIKKEGS